MTVKTLSSGQLASPLSFMGATIRIRILMNDRTWRHWWSNVLWTTATVLILVFAWAGILAWYAVLACVSICTFGVLPLYRAIRRGQRRKDMLARAQIDALNAGLETQKRIAE